ncbi:ANTAR domain-containing response regulator [Parazoarcus communis]|uniref:Response regulator n=1 Tax=Parazoarcus communis SWub3 = DSM 12120 TaxID=1121029 RepID=A0A323V3K1_9RHOO|nr:response regulator [Parazoarcus communis]NMG72163.1 response regulator [Parazoarcus communis SWub3 = DSM 12120]PZA14728.1 response regulator [Azoarcus communis] [Parazoarcus communis SWub3 = DSM 12120]
MKSVLLVDDDRVILNLLAEGLRDLGYEVAVAVSADEAIQRVGERSFDLAVLDMRMPGTSGLELAHMLIERSGPPFVFLSAYGDKSVVREAADAGAMGYLIKPVDVSQLVPFIEASIARAREIEGLRHANEHLEKALMVEQKTRTAVGIIMVRKGLDRQEAFDLLRARARSQRRKVSEIAESLIQAVEDINRLLRDER